MLGFSIAQYLGRSRSIRSRVRSAILSPATRSLGRLVRALENSVRGGLDHTKSGFRPSGGSHSMMSPVMSAPALGSASRLMTVQPNSLNAFPTEPVPENSSRSSV